MVESGSDRDHELLRCLTTNRMHVQSVMMIMGLSRHVEGDNDRDTDRASDEKNEL